MSNNDLDYKRMALLKDPCIIFTTASNSLHCMQLLFPACLAFQLPSTCPRLPLDLEPLPCDISTVGRRRIGDEGSQKWCAGDREGR